MSIQDESFPEDDFLEELDLSSNPRNFQYPINRNTLYKTTTSPTSNVSHSSADKNISSESANERPGSDLSGKTNASEPVGFAKSGKSPKTDVHPKAYSYMDIHSEYTKRRFKHVKSKVGQYIADMKADDEKSRSNTKKFQRHRSMPETIGHEEDIAENLDKSRHMPMCGYSADEIRKMDDSSDGEVDFSARNANESGASDMLIAARESYSLLAAEKDRIQLYNDFLEEKLKEKNNELLRLKRNIDYLRIEVTTCKDKLKRQATVISSNHINQALGSYKNENLGALSRQSANQVSSKATQTELITPSSLKSQQRIIPCELSTPESMDSNNNSLGDESDKVSGLSQTKAHQNNDSNEQGFVRQRSNSNKMMQAFRKNLNSNQCYGSSSDCAIDMVSMEMHSIGQQLHRDKQKTRTNGHQLMNTTFIELSPLSKNDSDYSNTTQTANLIHEVTDNSNMDDGVNNNSNNHQQQDRKKKPKKKKQKKTLRGRFIHFFTPCIKCVEPKHMDVSLTQAPLL